MGALVLAGGLVSETAGSESTVAVMVLCPGDLPEGIPGCEAVAEALDAEIEEFSMFAVPGPSPAETPPQEVAGPGVPFVLWTTAFAESLTLHVYEAENAVEVSKTLDLATMDEVPSAYDLAILYRDIMGTSLYAGLAELENDALLDLAIPEEKEEVVLERAAAGKGKASIPMDLKMWFPQFVMGWSLISYPGARNTNRPISDIYNGLSLSLRLPFKERFWAGVSLILTQSLTHEFEYDLPSGDVSNANFIDDQILINLDVAWYPYMTERIGIFVGGGPGLTRTATELVETAAGKVGTAAALRMTLATLAGFQVTFAPRVRLETAARFAYCMTLNDSDRLVLVPEGNEDYSYKFFERGDIQISFWLSMVFG